MNTRCPNNCAGHGYCEFSSKCTCYTGWNGGAADCSLRECPHGIAWADKPYESDKAHQKTECSNAGYCDRDKGVCVCYPGFSGNACQRVSCPNSCSSHGKCGTIKDVSYFEGPDYNSILYFAGDGFGTTYNEWDKNSVSICECDQGYFGSDCSLVMCPKGDDPLTVNQNYRSIQLTVLSYVLKGKIGLQFGGKVSYISITNPGLCAVELTNSGLFGYVGCSYTSSSTTYSTFARTVTEYSTIFTIIFYSWPTYPKETNLYSIDGNPSIYDFYCDITYTDSSVVCNFADVQSSNIREYSFCSNRGNCNFGTGTCSCLDGFGGPACANMTYLYHHGSNSKPGLEVSVYGYDYTSTALQMNSVTSASTNFKFIEAIAASETVFYVEGDGTVGINKLSALSGGITISSGGLKVISGGMTIANTGMNVYSSSAYTPVGYFESDYTGYLSSSYVALQVATNSYTTNHFLFSASNQGSTLFTVQSNGQVVIYGGGLTVTGGITINSGGMQVTGGVTIRTGGLTVSSNGIKVTGGVTVNTGGLQIVSGGLQIFGGGMSVYSGGLKVFNGMSVLSAGVAITGGTTVFSNGLKVTGGLTIYTGGLYVTTKGLTVATGGVVVRNGGLTIQNEGLKITAGGMTVLFGGIYVTTKGLTIANDGINVQNGGITISQGGFIVTGGVTVYSNGMKVSGGVTVFDTGLFVTGGVTVTNGLQVTAGGLTVDSGVLSATGGLRVSGGITVFNTGMTVNGGLVVNGGLTVFGAINYQSTPTVFSDRRLKNNILPIKNALRKLTKLQGVYYNWIQNEPSGLTFDTDRHVGVMAQEVLSVLPEAVDQSSHSKYLGVNYNNLVPLLIEAIRELDDVVTDKKNQRNNYKNPDSKNNIKDDITTSSNNMITTSNENCDYNNIIKILGDINQDLESVRNNNKLLFEEVNRMNMEVNGLLKKENNQNNNNNNKRQLLKKSKMNLYLELLNKNKIPTGRIGKSVNINYSS